MTVYVPTFPLAASLISAAPNQFQINFQQLNSIFASDHYQFNISGAAGSGYHRQVTFQSVISDPNKAAPICSLYTKTVGSAQQLFFQNGNMAANVVQVTSDGGFQTYTPTVAGATSFTGLVSNGYYAIIGGLTQFTIVVTWSGASGPFSNLTATLPTTAKATGGSFMYQDSTNGVVGPKLISAAATTVSPGFNLPPGALGFTFSGYYI